MEQSNIDRFMYIDDLNREVRSFRSERLSCVVDGCSNKPISSHLIPKSWQSLIARDGLIVNLDRTLPANTPTTREAQFYENYFQIVSRPISINLATADPVFCSCHDGDKRAVGLLDDPESELRSTMEQHILFYKAICFSLYECERVSFLLNEIMERHPRDTIERDIYFQERQKVAHLNLLSKFHQCLKGGCDRGCAMGSHMEFRRLFMQGDGIPTVSAIGCGSGLVNCGITFGCRSIGCEFARGDFMVACKPMGNGHILVIARTRRESLGSGYCRQAGIRYKEHCMSNIFDYSPPQGVELELFVSQELIESSKGFLCSPDRWERFGSRMRNLVKHHFVEQPSRNRTERQSRFPTEMNRTFNLFRSIE